MSYQTNYILLTIDVEDWFQVENFKQYIPFASWSSYELRVEKNTHRILDLIDSYYGQRSTDNRQNKKLKGTFFVLGWLAERLPHLVREIHSRGHEIASHGYYHNLCYDQSHEDLKTDLCNSKSLLEDIIGNQVYGYRAPSFAINNNILKIIEDCGYLYDSSYNSFALHGRYGQVSLSRNGQKGIAIKINSTKHQKHLPREIFIPLNSKTVQLGHDSDSEVYRACPVGMKYGTGVKSESHFTGAQHEFFYELPISNLEFMKSVLPWGGGGYFRLIPFPLFKLGVESILKKENAYLFYMHPWEIDADQPRVNDASTFYRFRHYSNLRKTHSKLLKLIENFVHCNFITCNQYLNEVMKYAL